MDEKLIENWNQFVKPGDTVYHLGDFAFAKTSEDVEKYLCRLNGTIYLITGNHDKEPTLSAKGFYLKNIYKEIIVQNTKIILFHYPLIEWQRKFHNALCFHGHCHGNIEAWKKEHNFCNLIDVGVDCWNYRPVSLRQILTKFPIKEMKK